jgi:hypothetical protein
MVGTAILASGLFSLWLSLATISDFVTLDRQRSDARLALASQLDGLRGTPFDQVWLGLTVVSAPALPNGEMTQTITAVTDDLRQIELTASWTTPTGPRSATVVTRIARGGIGGN